MLMSKHRVYRLSVFLTVLASLAPATKVVAEAPTVDVQNVEAPKVEAPKVDVVVTGLDRPWGMTEVAPENKIFLDDYIDFDDVFIPAFENDIGAAMVEAAIAGIGGKGDRFPTNVVMVQN